MSEPSLDVLSYSHEDDESGLNQVVRLVLIGGLVWGVARALRFAAEIPLIFSSRGIYRPLISKIGVCTDIGCGVSAIAVVVCIFGVFYGFGNYRSLLWATSMETALSLAERAQWVWLNEFAVVRPATRVISDLSQYAAGLIPPALLLATLLLPAVRVSTLWSREGSTK